ncbi:ATP-binding cassette domain-containing protein [Nocardioides sp. TF02-7]|uniref:ATP-binding cassette domain-containing protein n=1 Tax=Nocardioides sp. TF02-7 TaxID=2917724 RepID=UPI0031F5B1CE
MGLPKSRVDEMIALVGLTEAEAKRRMKNYSLGMKQRLGIAHALLGDPSVLILDEPANGLDPAGIRWMRSLLKSYADRGGTVLLSSHLLHEVEQIADEMILIGHGRIVARGDKQTLLANAGGGAITLVTSLDNESLAAELENAGHEAEPAGTGLRVQASTEQVGRAALAAGVVLTDLRSGGAGLEDIFLELTSGTAREAVPGAPIDHGQHLPPVPNMPPVDSPTQSHGGSPPMSTTTTPVPTLDVSGTPRTPFLRLVKVEWRKMLDTRAGRWLLGITAGLVLFAMAIVLLVTSTSASALSQRAWFEEVLLLPLSLLVPVIAIMAVTSEWSQRTAMVTFALEPHRSRVVLAKLVVVMGIAVAALATGYVLSLVGTVAGAAIDGTDPVWNLEVDYLAWIVALQLLAYVSAFGLSMLVLSTPAAIAVVYVVQLVLPIMVYLPLVFVFDWAATLIPWIDMTHASAPLFQTDGGESIEMTGEAVDVGIYHVARFGFSILLWVVAPLALGAARILRAELK